MFRHVVKRDAWLAKLRRQCGPGLALCLSSSREAARRSTRGSEDPPGRDAGPRRRRGAEVEVGTRRTAAVQVDLERAVLHDDVLLERAFGVREIDLGSHLPGVLQYLRHRPV